MKIKMKIRRECRELISLLSLCVLWVDSYTQFNPKDKPNIIFIMADDLGYGDLGCYGQRLIQTPNIDELAQTGMRFTNAYSGAPVCAPSRSVLMTGQHTGHTRVRDNAGFTGGDPDPLEGEHIHRIPLHDIDTTIAEVLKNAGYKTGIAGKWGLGEAGSSGIPNMQGFDEWYGYLNQNHADLYFTDYLWRNDQKVLIPENSNNRKGSYSHDLFVDFALDFIDRYKNESFFLYLPFTIPHFNLEVPELEDYTKDSDWPVNAKVYASMITRMDHGVGKIMKLLVDLGIDENTIVFFTSDNGPDFSKGNKGDSLFNSNGILRGHKAHMYEGGIRVPMIVRWPGKIPAARVNDNPWYFADVFPTLCELAKVKPPSDIDGISIVPTLMGNRQKVLSKRFMYWERPARKYKDFEQVLRYGKWKAIRKGGDNQEIRLYNLKADPGEQYDVASKNTKIINKFEEQLQNVRTDSPYYMME